jgi:PAS domain-containing protein
MPCSKTQREIYQAVLESMQNGIDLVDRSEEIRFWNEGAERITGDFGQVSLGIFAGIFSHHRNRKARTEGASWPARWPLYCATAGR